MLMAYYEIGFTEELLTQAQTKIIIFAPKGICVLGEKEEKGMKTIPKIGEGQRMPRTAGRKEHYKALQRDLGEKGTHM